MSKDPFRTRDHVPEFDDIVADMVRRSEAARAMIPMLSGVAYGDGPTETLDLFFPGGDRKDLTVHIFIHGGYWRMFSRADYSYIAETVTRAGAIAVIIGYARMPAVRMAAIVEQVRRAERWVLEHIGAYGGDAGRLTVSGHSAGAHLAALLCAEDSEPSGIRRALLLGGLYDLKPLQSSFLAPEIGITDDEAAQFSPIAHHFDDKVAVEIVVGTHETAPFHGQAGAFARRLEQQGLRVSQTSIAGTNHMSSVRDLGVAGIEAAARLHSVILA